MGKLAIVLVTIFVMALVLGAVGCCSLIVNVAPSPHRTPTREDMA